MSMTANTTLKAGFDEPVRDSQQAFRRLLDALSQPGRIVAPSAPAEYPAGLHRAAASACLALLDFETPLWLAGPDLGETRAWLAFHAGCRFVERPADAAFALVTDPAALPALDGFALGSDETPEQGATLILQVQSIAAGHGRRLTGPGIADERRLAVDGLADSFWAERAAICRLFPRGLDIFLTAGTALAALPRTTKVEG